MARLISDAYQKLNYELHKSGTIYGEGGHGFVDRATQLVSDYKARSLLDYGCGKGTLKTSLAKICPNLDIREYDPAIPGKTRQPAPADVVFSTDVMEHIEPDYIDTVLAHIADLTQKVAWLYISVVPAVKTLPDGRNAHLIVKPAEWWVSKISEHMTVREHQPNSYSNALKVLAEPR